MAEDKKSVLLYCDLIHTIEKMDDETAGQFFKHYLRYINDLKPKTDNLIVDVTFEAVKQSLKRDLKKWEVKKTGQSLAGIEGNLKRWHLDLYDEYKKGTYTLQDAVNIGKSREPSPPDPTRSTPIAKIAVSVSDSVSVTDSVTDTVIKNKSRAFAPPSLEEVKDYCKERNNTVNAETFIDFYASKGWVVGKTKMKDWKASIRTWEKRDNNGGNKTFSGTTSGGSRATSQVADSYD